MVLGQIDWIIIGGFFLFSLLLGLSFSKSASKNTTAFFLSGRNMPWWLLGISMVATTFSADTPNLVTDIVRQQGVSGNWVWWAFLLTGMLTVFVYSRLWRRSEVLTDLEFYELRYSGQPASWLRAFRAIYLGVFFNVIIMATVCLAAIKISGVLLGLSPVKTLLIASVVTMIYAALGGLKAVIVTDFFQFLLAMIGTIGAAYVIVSHQDIGGVHNLISHSAVLGKTALLPDFSNTALVIPLFVIPLAVQWWSVWYPGAEPGGGGYIAQRMLAAKSEDHALAATFLFNIAHYALRPWPWILIALASLIIYPLKLTQDGNQIEISPDAAVFLEEKVSSADVAELKEALLVQKEEASGALEKKELNRLSNVVLEQETSLDVKSLAFLYKTRSNEGRASVNILDLEKLVAIHLAFPKLEPSKIGQDVAYSAMLRMLPSGLLGLVIASLIAAFMSTLSTHLNWGSSYVVHDFYKRFIHPSASDRHLVWVGRLCTILLMFLAAILALTLGDALEMFNVLLQIGAGTGLIFILRWFWWRINAFSEITAMVVSFGIALYFHYVNDFGLVNHEKLLIGIGLTTVAWLLVTYLTPPTDRKTLLDFYKRIRPAQYGWYRALEGSEIKIEEYQMGGRAKTNTLYVFGLLPGICFALWDRVLSVWKIMECSSGVFGIRSYDMGINSTLEKEEV